MHFRETLCSYRHLWSVPNIRWLAAMQFLSHIAFYSTVVVAYQRSRGLDYAGIFMAESVLSAAIFLCEVPTGLLADRIGYRRMLQMGVALAAPLAGKLLGRAAAVALSVLVPGVAFLALRTVTAPAGTTLLVTLIIAGSAWRSPLLSDAINRRIPDGARATVLSSLSFAGGLAGMILNPLIGLAGDAGLGATAVALGAGLVALAGVTLLLRKEI